MSDLYNKGVAPPGSSSIEQFGCAEVFGIFWIVGLLICFSPLVFGLVTLYDDAVNNTEVRTAFIACASFCFPLLIDALCSNDSGPSNNFDSKYIRMVMFMVVVLPNLCCHFLSEDESLYLAMAQVQQLCTACFMLRMLYFSDAVEKRPPVFDYGVVTMLFVGFVIISSLQMIYSITMDSMWGVITCILAALYLVVYGYYILQWCLEYAELVFSYFDTSLSNSTVDGSELHQILTGTTHAVLLCIYCLCFLCIFIVYPPYTRENILCRIYVQGFIIAILGVSHLKLGQMKHQILEVRLRLL